MELVGVHLLLRSWSDTAVWIHIGLSAYGVIWLLGDFRAMRQRPHRLGPEGIRLRCGLRWEIDARWGEVAAVRRASRPTRDPGFLNAMPIGDPRYIVEFADEIEATGPWGIRRRIRSVGITADDAAEFERRLEAEGIEMERQGPAS